MSAFNNLIQAGDIIEEFPEKRSEVEKIIGGSRAVSYDDVAAFAITDGTVHPIKDDELRLISPSELDTASDNISNVFRRHVSTLHCKKVNRNENKITSRKRKMEL